MTATAIILEADHQRASDPYGLDLPDLATAWPPPTVRPDLQVLPGGAAGAAAIGALDPRVIGFDDRRRMADAERMVEIHRRRRFLVALVLTVVIVAVSQAFGISLTSFGPTPGSDESVPIVHVVRPGDTYPGIAATLGVDDPQAFTAELVRANGGAELVVGQRLVIDPVTLGSDLG